MTLSHRDPLSGEQVSSYHTVEGKTRKRAEKARDELIKNLESKGSAFTSKATLKEFLDEFIKYKEDSGAIERSTLNHYRKEARVLCRYIGGYRLADVTIPVVSGWMTKMTAEGYAPRSVSKPYGVLRQAMKHAMAIIVTKRTAATAMRIAIDRFSALFPGDSLGTTVSSVTAIRLGTSDLASFLAERASALVLTFAAIAPEKRFVTGSSDLAFSNSTVASVEASSNFDCLLTGSPATSERVFDSAFDASSIKNIVLQ